MKKLFVRLLLGSIFASIFMALMFIVTNNGGNVFGKLLIIMVIIATFSVVGIICASSFDNKKNLLVSILGMGMAIFAMFYFGSHTWNSYNYDGVDTKIAGMIIVSNLFFIWIGTVLDDRVEQFKNKWIRISTAVIITITALLMMFIIWNIGNHIDILIYRTIGITLSLSVIGSIVVLVIETKKGIDLEHVLIPEIKAVKEEDLPQVLTKESVSFVEVPNQPGQFMQVRTETVGNEVKK